MINFNTLEEIKNEATRIHEINERWWVDIETGIPFEQRDIDETIILMISELIECMEGERKNLMDDKLPHRKMAEVEMADFIIRLLDASKGYNIEIKLYSKDITPVVGKKYTYLNQMIKDVHRMQYMWELSFTTDISKVSIGKLVRMAEKYCEKFGYDLWGAVDEKNEYNKQREDHKIENRMKEGGKKI